MDTTAIEVKGRRGRGERRRRAGRQGHPRLVATVVVASVAVIAAAVAAVDLMAVAGVARWVGHEQLAAVERAPKGVALAVGETVEGTIGSSPTTSSADKSFVDYSLRVGQPGIYRVALESDSPSKFEPFVVIRRNDNIVENAFAFDGMPAANAIEPLLPGAYTVRVTSLREGPLPTPAHFKLSIGREHILRDV